MITSTESKMPAFRYGGATSIAVMALACAAWSGQAVAQPVPLPHQMVPCLMDSGLHNGGQDRFHVAYSETITKPGAPWLRLHFGKCNLGANSYIVVRSLQDDGQQRLDSTALAQWQGISAFFNGDSVELQLQVAPGDDNIIVRMKEVMVGDWNPLPSGGPDSLCGPDDRIASSDPAIGRLVGSGGGCTGWIASNGALLSAGHCAGALQALQFNVPPSLCDGTIQHPGPDDQYVVDPVSILLSNNGFGDDWSIWECFANSNTGLTPVQAQGAFLRMSRDDNPANITVTGYGVDETPPGCTGGRNAQSQTEQTDTGPFLAEVVQGPSRVELHHQADSEGGNSGGPIIIAGTNVAIGIHTNGWCHLPPLWYNGGCGFENDALENAIHAFPGANMIYVDAAHPHAAGLGDGTVLRPFDMIADAVNAVPAGGTISIVSGSYNETMTINKAMTLTAPVGTVTIGQ